MLISFYFHENVAFLETTKRETYWNQHLGGQAAHAQDRDPLAMPRKVLPGV